MAVKKEVYRDSGNYSLVFHFNYKTVNTYDVRTIPRQRALKFEKHYQHKFGQNYKTTFNWLNIILNVEISKCSQTIITQDMPTNAMIQIKILKSNIY